MKLYNKNIVSALRGTGLNRRQSEVALQTVLGQVRESLTNGIPVVLQGLGSFRLTERKQRHYKLPNRPTVDVIAPAHKAVVFRASPVIRKALQA